MSNVIILFFCPFWKKRRKFITVYTLKNILSYYTFFIWDTCIILYTYLFLFIFFTQLNNLKSSYFLLFIFFMN